MIRFPNPFAKRRMDRAQKAVVAIGLSVPTQDIGKASSALKREMHSRLLGYVANRRPDRAEAISAKLSLAASLNEGRGAL